MSISPSSNQLAKLEREIAQLEQRIVRDCQRLDELRGEHIRLACPFKRGDKVKYNGFDKFSVVYRVVAILPRGRTYRLLCVAKNSKGSWSKTILSPLKVTKLT